MPFVVQIGPPQISIHQGQTVLISEPDGQINWPSERGLYFLDTRVVSSWAVYANGEAWELLNGGAYHLLRGADFPYQPFFRDGSRHHSAAHARLHHQPMDSWRHA